MGSSKKLIEMECHISDYADDNRKTQKHWSYVTDLGQGLNVCRGTNEKNEWPRDTGILKTNHIGLGKLLRVHVYPIALSNRGAKR